MEKNSNQPLNQAERYQYLIGLTEGKQLDADYRAAFYILSSVPEMFEAAAKCVDHEGITFDKIKRLCKGKLEESQMHLLSLAHNVFAWNSRTSPTPHELSRLGYPDSDYRRGRVGKQCSQTLLTGANMGVLVYCRIRKLTPKECFRLQAFDDFLFDRAKAAGVSDAQLYKQAGNSVTVNIVYEIGVRLKKMEGCIHEI